MPEPQQEAPQCNDGIDNDGDGGTDYDGGVSAGVTPDPDGADRNCTKASRNSEVCWECSPTGSCRCFMSPRG